jgi:hypothetical protein
MAEWWNGGMAEWQNGRMAEWQNGGMAEWHNVWYEIVRNQDTESTQMPPWQSPSWLVLYKKIVPSTFFCVSENFSYQLYRFPPTWAQGGFPFLDSFFSFSMQALFTTNSCAKFV